MSNDFWFSMAIAVVVGGFWLYKKGKNAVLTIRKIHRSFKGVCLNPKSKLSDEQCKKLAVGAMYASQQGAYQILSRQAFPTYCPRYLGNGGVLKALMQPRRSWTISVKKGTGITSLLCIRHFCLASRKPRMKSFSRT